MAALLRWRVLVVVLALSGFTAGCGGGDKPSPSTGAAPATGEPVELVVWNWFYAGEQTAIWDEYDALFTARHPNITIKQVGLTGSNPDIFAKIRSGVAAGKGADVVTIHGGVFPAGMQKGFLPLQDRVTDEQREDVLYIDVTKSPDGNLYGWPWTSYAYVFLYNKKHFKQAGLDPEAPPATWDELLAACDSLKAAGIAPIGTGWKDGVGADAWYWTGASQALDSDRRVQWASGELDPTAPEIAVGINAMLELNERACFQEEADSRLFYYDVKDQFDQGKSAMILWPVGFGDAVGTAEKALGEGALGMFGPPPMPGANWENATDAGPNTGFGITSYSEHPDEAWQYLSFLTSKEGQEFAAEKGYFVNNRTVETVNDSVVHGQILDLLNTSDSFALFEGMPEPSMDVFRKNSLGLLKGDTTVEEVQKQMVPPYEKVLGSFR